MSIIPKPSVKLVTGQSLFPGCLCLSFLHHPLCNLSSWCQASSSLLTGPKSCLCVYRELSYVTHPHFLSVKQTRIFVFLPFPVCHLTSANELLPKYFLMLMKCFVYSCAQEVTPSSAEGATSQECQRHVLSSRVSFPRSDH